MGELGLHWYSDGEKQPTTGDWQIIQTLVEDKWQFLLWFYCCYCFHCLSTFYTNNEDIPISSTRNTNTHKFGPFFFTAFRMCMWISREGIIKQKKGIPTRVFHGAWWIASGVRLHLRRNKDTARRAHSLPSHWGRSQERIRSHQGAWSQLHTWGLSDRGTGMCEHSWSFGNRRQNWTGSCWCISLLKWKIKETNKKKPI